MSVYLLVYDHFNGEQRIIGGRYGINFILKGTGEERYQSFQVNITAQQDRNNTNRWRIDVSTKSKNIDLETWMHGHAWEWMHGHAFHSMTIHISPASGSWYH